MAVVVEYVRHHSIYNPENLQLGARIITHTLTWQNTSVFFL